MALQHTPKKIIFNVILPDNTEEEFSLAEYLAWRESVGAPIPEKDWLEWTDWLKAENNNLGRISALTSIRTWRQENPKHFASRKDM